MNFACLKILECIYSGFCTSESKIEYFITAKLYAQYGKYLVQFLWVIFIMLLYSTLFVWNLLDIASGSNNTSSPWRGKSMDGEIVGSEVRL